MVKLINITYPYCDVGVEFPDADLVFMIDELPEELEIEPGIVVVRWVYQSERKLFRRHLHVSDGRGTQYH